MSFRVKVRSIQSYTAISDPIFFPFTIDIYCVIPKSLKISRLAIGSVICSFFLPWVLRCFSVLAHLENPSQLTSPDPSSVKKIMVHLMLGKWFGRGNTSGKVTWQSLEYPRFPWGNTSSSRVHFPASYVSLREFYGFPSARPHLYWGS